MGWNYRIVRTINSDTSRPGYDYWAIHEVYYLDNGEPESITQEACGVVGGSEQELREEFVRYEKALRHPILVFDDAKNEFVDNTRPQEGE